MKKKLYRNLLLNNLSDPLFDFWNWKHGILTESLEENKWSRNESNNF